MAPPLNQKSARKLLESHGWTMTLGGRHVVEMVKAGERPITLPRHGGRDCGKGYLRRSGSKRDSGTRPSKVRGTMEYRVVVREEDGSCWGEVKELPGCFASGRDLEELRSAVVEAIALYLSDDVGTADSVRAQAHVDEFRVLVPA